MGSSARIRFEWSAGQSDCIAQQASTAQQTHTGGEPVFVFAHCHVAMSLKCVLLLCGIEHELNRSQAAASPEPRLPLFGHCTVGVHSRCFLTAMQGTQVQKEYYDHVRTIRCTVAVNSYFLRSLHHGPCPRDRYILLRQLLLSLLPIIQPPGPASCEQRMQAIARCGARCLQGRVLAANFTRLGSIRSASSSSKDALQGSVSPHARWA